MNQATILIADDERHIRETFSAALEDEGYNVVAVEDGTRVEALVSSGEVDLLLLDLRMPGLDGMEVLRQVEENHPEVPVVIVSAHGSVDEAIHAVEMGASAFIEKPCTPEQLRAVVAHALDPEQQRMETASSYERSLASSRRSLEAGELDAAAEHAARAMEIDPTRPEAFNMMGVVMQVRAHLAEARRLFQAALALNPAYEPAQENQQNLAESPSERKLGRYRLD